MISASTFLRGLSECTLTTNTDGLSYAGLVSSLRGYDGPTVLLFGAIPPPIAAYGRGGKRAHPASAGGAEPRPIVQGGKPEAQRGGRPGRSLWTTSRATWSTARCFDIRSIPVGEWMIISQRQRTVTTPDTVVENEEFLKPTRRQKSQINCIAY